MFFVIVQYVQVLSSLDHSCIVRVLCVTLDDSKVGIGYQFMPYGSLLLFMHQRRRYITSKALLTYCSQVCNVGWASGLLLLFSPVCILEDNCILLLHGCLQVTLLENVGFVAGIHELLITIIFQSCAIRPKS